MPEDLAPGVYIEETSARPKSIEGVPTFGPRDFRVRGGRTLSEDPEWKYVNVRRYVSFLEASIAKGTQWAVFEPNGERLWAIGQWTADRPPSHHERRRSGRRGAR